MKKNPSKSRYTQSKTGNKGGEYSQPQGVNINPLAAAAAGAVVGAAAGAVAGAVLSNDKTRKRVGYAIQAMGDRAMDTVQKVADRAPQVTKSLGEAKKSTGKKVQEGKEKMEK
ncbi:MAG: hypothetical protein KGL95_13305 [Patescibacteria group bacterium]|nr:hypothetical protein [Patescibacteria group bacterium]